MKTSKNAPTVKVSSSRDFQHMRKIICITPACNLGGKKYQKSCHSELMKDITYFGKGLKASFVASPNPPNCLIEFDICLPFTRTLKHLLFILYRRACPCLETVCYIPISQSERDTFHIYFMQAQIRIYIFIYIFLDTIF